MRYPALVPAWRAVLRLWQPRSDRSAHCSRPIPVASSKSACRDFARCQIDCRGFSHPPLAPKLHQVCLPPRHGAVQREPRNLIRYGISLPQCAQPIRTFASATRYIGKLDQCLPLRSTKPSTASSNIRRRGSCGKRSAQLRAWAITWRAWLRAMGSPVESKASVSRR